MHRGLAEDTEPAGSGTEQTKDCSPQDKVSYRRLKFTGPMTTPAISAPGPLLPLPGPPKPLDTIWKGELST